LFILSQSVKTQSYSKFMITEEADYIVIYEASIR